MLKRSVPPGIPAQACIALAGLSRASRDDRCAQSAAVRAHARRTSPPSRWRRTLAWTDRFLGKTRHSGATVQPSRGLSACGRSCRPLRSYVRPLSNALWALSTQWPWTPYGSGMQVAKPGHRRRSPRLDRRSESVAVDDVGPKINDGQVVSPPALPFPCPARSHEAGRTGAPYRLGARKLPSARPIRRSPGNPHGCWTSQSRFTVNSKIDLTVNFRRELNATFLPSDLPSN
jgi:hypothetical protein